MERQGEWERPGPVCKKSRNILDGMRKSVKISDRIARLWNEIWIQALLNAKQVFSSLDRYVCCHFECSNSNPSCGWMTRDSVVSSAWPVRLWNWILIGRGRAWRICLPSLLDNRISVSRWNWPMSVSGTTVVGLPTSYTSLCRSTAPRLRGNVTHCWGWGTQVNKT